MSRRREGSRRRNALEAKAAAAGGVRCRWAMQCHDSVRLYTNEDSSKDSRAERVRFLLQHGPISRPGPILACPCFAHNLPPIPRGRVGSGEICADGRTRRAQLLRRSCLSYLVLLSLSSASGNTINRTCHFIIFYRASTTYASCSRACAAPHWHTLPHGARYHSPDPYQHRYPCSTGPAIANCSHLSHRRYRPPRRLDSTTVLSRLCIAHKAHRPQQSSVAYSIPLTAQISWHGSPSADRRSWLGQKDPCEYRVVHQQRVCGLRRLAGNYQVCVVPSHSPDRVQGRAPAHAVSRKF